jgi:hypothetical protein
MDVSRCPNCVWNPWAPQAAGNVLEFPTGKNLKLYVSKDHHLYMQALDDFEQGPGEAIYVIKGKYKLAQGATALRDASQNWVSGELTADSPVTVQLIHKGQDAPPVLPSGVNTFEAVLQALCEANFVRCRLQGHELSRVEGSRKYTVTSTTPAALEVTVVDTTKDPESGPKLGGAVSNFVDISMVKSSPYLQAAQVMVFAIPG